MAFFLLLKSEVRPIEDLYHHGIKGQKWYVRRYQNPDGTLTELGRKRMEKKDNQWAKKNYSSIYKSAYKASRKELLEYVSYLNKVYDGQISKSYANELNRKYAQLMNQAVDGITAPSGRAVKFIAKRGEVGVHMALADEGYDMNNVRNGVYSSGRIAYRKTTLEKS